MFYYLYSHIPQFFCFLGLSNVWPEEIGITFLLNWATGWKIIICSVKKWSRRESWFRASVGTIWGSFSLLTMPLSCILDLLHTVGGARFELSSFGEIQEVAWVESRKCVYVPCLLFFFHLEPLKLSAPLTLFSRKSEGCLWSCYMIF